MEIQRFQDSDICYKQTDPQTLKTVAFVQPNCLIPDEKVSIDEMVAAAHELSRELVDFKYNKLKGIGCSQIDTSICVNYYGTMFTVTQDMSLEAAKEAYNKVLRDAQRKKIGLKLV
ncbi:MAG: hypothetical protein ACTHPO_06465 [Alphaproteobacteria bacterium]